PDKKSREQQRDAKNRAARIRRQRAGTLRVEQLKQVGEQRQRPHRGVFGGRKGVEQNRVRRWQRRLGGASVRASRSQQRWKISEQKLPVYFMRAVGELDGVLFQ